MVEKGKKLGKMKKIKKEIEIEQQLAELTQDLQRTRADFENYRKRAEADRISIYESGQTNASLKLLPVIDNIERAIFHAPKELQENTWVQGVASLTKNLEKSLDDMNIKRIVASPGTIFNPDLHEAIQFDEQAEGDSLDSEEVIAEEMQAGYTLNGRPIRHAMVKVTRR